MHGRGRNAAGSAHAALVTTPSRASVLREPVARAWLMPFVIAGVACIVAGGLLAAATAYVSTQKTAWATAYIVLVGGVAQVALGAAVTWLRPSARPRPGWVAFACWNLGNAGVLAGQLAGVVALTDIGAALLVVGLGVVLFSIARGAPAGLQRGASPSPATDQAPAPPITAAQRTPAEPVAPTFAPHPLLLGAFRLLIVILAAGIVVGTVLAHVTA